MDVSEEDFAQNDPRIFGRHHREAHPTERIATHSSFLIFILVLPICLFVSSFPDMQLARAQAMREARQDRQQHLNSTPPIQPFQTSQLEQYPETGHFSVISTIGV